MRVALIGFLLLLPTPSLAQQPAPCEDTLRAARIVGNLKDFSRGQSEEKAAQTIMELLKQVEDLQQQLSEAKKPKTEEKK